MPQSIYYNGLDGRRGRYARPPEQVADLARQLRERAIFRLQPDRNHERLARLVRWVTRPQKLADVIERQELYEPLSDASADNLAEAGWGVIFPEENDNELKEALAPLLQLRQLQCGNRYREFHYDASQFSFQFLNALDNQLKQEGLQIPYYLLIVGPPTQIPFLVQYGLDIEHAVGRLCFEQLDDYRNYAERTVARESIASAGPCKAAFFGPSHADEPLSQLVSKYMINHLARKVSNTYQPNQVAVRTFSPGEALKPRLASMMGGPTTPDLLMVAAHGLMFNKSAREMRPLQGALVCDDWPGPRRWPGAKFPTKFYYAAADLDAQTDLRGMTAFIYSCFSAGVPVRDNMSFSSETGTQYSDEPFLTALPQRMLQQGCAGLVGHVDAAYPWSFSDYFKRERTKVFETFFKAYLDGCTLGHALSIFQREYAVNLARYHEIYESQKDGKYLEDIQVVQFWLCINDLRNYILLGDPAIRLKATT